MDIAQGELRTKLVRAVNISCPRIGAASEMINLDARGNCLGDESWCRDFLKKWRCQWRCRVTQGLLSLETLKSLPNSLTLIWPRNKRTTSSKDQNLPADISIAIKIQSIRPNEYSVERRPLTCSEILYRSQPNVNHIPLPCNDDISLDIAHVEPRALFQDMGINSQQ